MTIRPDAPPPRDPSSEPNPSVASDSLPMIPDKGLAKVIRQLAAMGPPLSEMTPQEARDAAAAFFELPATPSETLIVTDLEIPSPTQPIRAKLYRPSGKEPCPLFVTFHGGGWVLGSLAMFDREARAIATHSRCAVLSIDYRLAPEHPFPAAVEDAFTAVEWAAENAASLGCDPTRLGVAGSSAGGNLATVCALLARDQGRPAIRHQFLVYPVTDCDFERPTMHAFATGLLLERQDMIYFWNHYCPDLAQRKDFRASPIHAPSLVGMPSATILLAAMDPLLDEGLDYAARLKEAGVRTDLRVGPHMIHGFFDMGAYSEAAADEIKRACECAGEAMESKR